MWLAGTSERHVEVVMDVYDKAKTAVSSAAGLTDEFEVGVGLYQGSALSPFLFAIIMDELTKDIRREAPCDMLFADDIVLCRESRQELEEALDAWRVALENRGLKVSRNKTVAPGRQNPGCWRAGTTGRDREESGNL